MTAKPPRDRMAFEPRQKKKKTPKAPPAENQAKLEKSQPKTNRPKANYRATSGAIPEAVSKRMIRRMALFCGIPSGLGMSSFFVFYWIVRNDLLDIPAAAVGAVSLGLFGLGVLGLSYGILSTSWDEDRLGGWFGWQEFTVNFGRMRAAWKEAKEAKKKVNEG
jgi:hypothetical protein